MKIRLKIDVNEFEFSKEELRGDFSIAVRSSSNRKIGSEIFRVLDQRDERDKSKGFNPVSIELDLGEQSTFEPDDRLVVEALTSTENSEGQMSPTRGGQASVLLSELHKEVKKNNAKILIECRMPQLVVDENPYKKGILSVEVQNPKEISNWKFKSINKYHVLECNNKGIESALMKCVDWQERVASMRSHPEVESVVMPLMTDEEYLPGQMFFTDFSQGDDYKKREKFYLNALDISLNREGKTRKWLVSEIKTMKESKKVSSNISSICSIVSRTAALCSVSTYYKGDNAYARGKLESIEEFSLSDRFQKLGRAGSDCEDTGNLNFYHFSAIQRSSFESDDMKTVQWFSRNYIPFGALTSVQGRELADAKGHNIKLYIGDENDKKVEFGAHIFCLSMPFTRALRMIKSGTPNFSPSNFRNEYLNWGEETFADQLPDMVHEGTGDLHPFVFPLECYHTDKKIREKEKETHIKKRNAQKLLMSYDSIGMGTVHRLPSKTSDEPSARFDFYRVVGALYTDAFNKETADEFLLVDQKTGARGVEMRYLLYSSNKIGNPRNERNFQVPALRASPRFSPEDTKYYLSLKRQLPFKSDSDRISEEGVKRISSSLTRIGAKRNESLQSFIQECSKIMDSRSHFSGSATNTVVSYKHDDFFDMITKGKDTTPTPLAREILKDIEKEPRIIGVSAELVLVSDDVSVVDMNFKVLDESPQVSQKQIKSSVFSKQKNMDPHFPLVVGKDLFNIRSLFLIPTAVDGVLSKMERYTQDYLNHMKKTDPSFSISEDAEKYFGFRAFINLFYINQIRDAAMWFMTSPLKRAMIAPWMTKEAAVSFKNLITSGSGMNLSIPQLAVILLDHLFLWKDSIKQSLALKPSATSAEFLNANRILSDGSKKTIRLDMHGSLYEDHQNFKWNFHGEVSLIYKARHSGDRYKESRDPGVILDSTNVAFFRKFGAIDVFAAKSLLFDNQITSKGSQTGPDLYEKGPDIYRSKFSFKYQ